MGGDSVLINGRPLNGAIETAPDPGHTPPPLQVTSIGGKAIGVSDRVRVTGVLALDCGHGFRDGSVPGEQPQLQQSGDPSRLRHRPHRRDLAGKSDRRLGRQLRHDLLRRQVGDTVWWFGMGPFRNDALAQVFQGVATNGTIAGSWQDVPLATASSGEPLELAIDPGRMLLTPISSASLSGRRWMKLYDAGVPSA